MARVKVISPSGEAGDIPEEQLAAAMAQGYKKADAGPAAQPAAVEPEASEPASGDADSDDMLTATLKQIPGFLGGIVKGAAKGVGNMITGAGDMAGHLPSDLLNPFSPNIRQVVDSAYGQPGLSKTAFAEAHRELQPHGAGEHIGKFGADVAALALAPGESIPAMIGGNALITGTQTGGDPTAMAVSGALAGTGGLVAKGLNKLATGTARGQAEVVSARRTAEAAKRAEGGSANNAMNDPLWMKAQEGNTTKFTTLIQKYGLTGQPEKDIAIISKAPEREQEVLSALSRQMNPAKHQLGHEWSMAELAGNAMPAALAGSAVAGPLGGATTTAGILLVRSLMKKYPGIAAKLFGQGAGLAPGLGQLSGMAAGQGVQEDDPMVAELMRRER
jgi:hypothetical protein